jgi:hypothetical protein
MLKPTNFRSRKMVICPLFYPMNHGKNNIGDTIENNCDQSEQIIALLLACKTDQ